MKKITLLLLTVMLSAALYGAEYGGVTASPYLNLGVGARACGMGEAYTAVVDTVDAAWWNPGALVKVVNPQFALMHNENFGGTSYEYLGVAFPAEQLGLDIWGTIGITALLVRVQDVSITKEENVSGNMSQYSVAQELRDEYFGAGGTVLGISYSWQAAKMFSVGATLKLINQKIALEEGWIPALDLGILANTNMPGFDVGLVFQNVSFMQMNQVEGAPDAPLPLNLKFGVGYKIKRLFTPETDPRDNLTLAIDGILPLQPANMPYRLHLGVEYTYNIEGNVVKPRLGYRFNGNEFISDLGPLAGLTTGFGYSRNFDGVDIGVDYAFVPYGDLGVSHRFGLSINVGEPTPTPTPVKVKPPKVVRLKVDKGRITVSWDLAKVKDKDGKEIPDKNVKGYNVYISYKPGGKYHKLNKTVLPAGRNSLSVSPLKSGIRCYFVVTSVGQNDKESEYSKEISAVPR